MTSEIPADINVAAANCFWEIMRDAPTQDVEGEACLSASVGREIIAKALLAERQAQQTRAVAILSGIGDILARHIADSATPELLDAIGAAIRQDNPNET